MTYCKTRHGFSFTFSILLLIGAVQLCCAGLPKAFPPTFVAAPSVEAWRIRIINDVEGPIEVSSDMGATWKLIGRVTNPATRVLQGYLAAGYAPIGTVAATAVHGIRIRLGSTTDSYPNLINIVPKEFAITPMYFGGHISGASGIYTDIPAGTSLFRELAPYVGSETSLESGDGILHPLSEIYSPEIGDRLVIVVKRPVNPLMQVIFPNVTGAPVTATYGDGTTQIVTNVARPVQGVGRFDGTSYTGVGAINTNHCCVLTISTAPVTKSTILEGVGPERRGGFQIEPAYHNSQTEEASAPQILIIGPYKAHSPSIEGTPPIFSGYFGLAWSPADPLYSWVCDIKTSSKPNEWQPMPEIIGNQPNAFTKLGVIAFRVHRSQATDESIVAKWIADDHNTYSYSRLLLAQQGKIDVARGAMPIQISLLSTPSYVSLYVDGDFAGMTNSPPYSFDWNSNTVGDGEHVIEARAVDSGGDILSSLRKLIWVDNAHRIKSQ
jgi:hypothetical protein